MPKKSTTDNDKVGDEATRSAVVSRPLRAKQVVDAVKDSVQIGLNNTRIRVQRALQLNPKSSKKTVVVAQSPKKSTPKMSERKRRQFQDEVMGGPVPDGDSALVADDEADDEEELIEEPAAKPSRKRSRKSSD